MNESRRLEFKETVTSSTWLKTVSAFANYDGGKIVFGIDDEGTVVGVADPRSACLDIENRINDSVRPVPDYELEVRDDRTIILTVHEGRYKPYFHKGRAYKRSDTATVEADRMEYIRLILEGENWSFEEMTSSKQDLSFSSLEKALSDRLGIRRMDSDILKTLDLYSDKNGYNNAAALVADRNEFHGIDIVRFGDSIDRIMYRETFEHQSVLDQYEGAARVYRMFYQYEQIEGTERARRELIPEKAFREAVANALVHRTWDVPAAITVSMFSDRVEIRSPGGLPPGITEDEYLNNQVSVLRNPVLGNLFFRLRYIERLGTGILRINDAYKDSLVKPQYHIFENSIRVVLPVFSSACDLGEHHRKIVELIRKHGSVQRKQLENETGWKKDRIVRILNLLIEKSAIVKEGTGRMTRYRLR